MRSPLRLAVSGARSPSIASGAGSLPLGRYSEKREPLPSTLCSSSVSPIAATRRSTMGQPEPQPLRHPGALFQPREFGEQELVLVAGKADAGVDDVETHPAAARRQPTSTRPPGRVYLMAFDTKFCTIRPTSARSALATAELPTRLSSIDFSSARGANSTRLSE